MSVNPDLTVVHAFVDALYSSGVRHAVISPGSRSTPMTMTLSRYQGIRVWTALDERSAAFFALGMSKRSGEPTVLVCTSGTATGNYLPAVMEASQTEVPLIVVTTDRPPELHGIGSNQTIDQIKLFGTLVKRFIQMPVPENKPVLHRHASHTAVRAVASALNVPRGPVHINWPFREPLIPPVFTENSYVGSGAPRYYENHSEPNREAFADIKQALSKSEKPLVICGPMDEVETARAVFQFGSALAIPILADPLSQVRQLPGNMDSKACVVDTYDVLLRSKSAIEHFTPDLVIRFGKTPTSKALGQSLSSWADAVQVVVTHKDDWPDATMSADVIVETDVSGFCSEFLTELDDRHVRSGSRWAGWHTEWIQLQNRLRHALQAGMAILDERVSLFEGRLFRELEESISQGTHLFVGNSMPVRDLDSFWNAQGKVGRVFANRGVSGIDGVVSTAFGVSAQSQELTVLVIGDISFYHDLNALHYAGRFGLSLIIILVHNNGGGIFSFLPQSAHLDTFEHFRTPHGIDFEPAVRMFGGTFERAEDWTALRQLVQRAAADKGLHVIEVRTDTDVNVEMHRVLIAGALKEVGYQ